MADKTKLFQRYFGISAKKGAKDPNRALHASHRQRGGKFKDIKWTPAVQRLWSYWQNQCHDFPGDYQVRRQLWQDMDTIYFNGVFASRAINLTAAEVVQADSNVQPIWVEGKDKKVNDFIMKLFDDTQLYPKVENLAREVVQYGNALWLFSFHRKGIEEILPINIYDFEDRIEFSPQRLRRELKNSGGYVYRMRDKHQRVQSLVDAILETEDYSSAFKNYLFGYQVANQVLPPWRGVHFRNYTTKSPFAPYGVPVFIHSLAPYRQFDAAMTLQIAKRGAELPMDRYNINLPSTLNPTDKLEKVAEFIEELDNSGIGTTKKEGPGVGDRIITISDLFEYDQISPDINIGRVDDIDLLRDDLIISTGLPREILDPSGGFGSLSGVAVAQQFKPYARLVYGIQTMLMDGFTQMVKIHMIQSGEFEPSEIDFRLAMPFPESQTNSDIISSQSDLLSLANDILDSLSDKLLGGDTENIPPDLIRTVYQQILPYDQERVDKWINTMMQQRKAMAADEEAMDNQEDSEFGEALREAHKRKRSTTKNWKRLKETSPKLIKETVKNMIYSQKQERLREGALHGKHYYSSCNKTNSSFKAEDLLKYDKKRLEMMKEEHGDNGQLNDYLKEETVYSFSEAHRRAREDRKQRKEYAIKDREIRKKDPDGRSRYKFQFDEENYDREHNEQDNETGSGRGDNNSG